MFTHPWRVVAVLCATTGVNHTHECVLSHGGAVTRREPKSNAFQNYYDGCHTFQTNGDAFCVSWADAWFWAKRVKPHRTNAFG